MEPFISDVLVKILLNIQILKKNICYSEKIETIEENGGFSRVLCVHIKIEPYLQLLPEEGPRHVGVARRARH